MDLLTDHKYAPEFLVLIENNIIKFKPWEIIFGERLNQKYRGLTERIPGQKLMPFAVRNDCDDVACWDLNTIGSNVVVIHDYSKHSWDQRVTYNSFWDWFKQSIDDMIDFANDDIEYERNKSL